MKYQLAYTGEQMDDTARHTLTPDYFGYRVDDDVGDTEIIGTVDTYVTITPDVSHLIPFITDEFSYNSTTGVITYEGSGEFYFLSGSVSLDYTVINTIVHFGIAVNGTIVGESSVKLESSTAIATLSLNTPFNLSNGDEIEIQVKADKTGTMIYYHIQGLIREVKPSLHT